MAEVSNSARDRFFNFISWLEKLLVVAVAAGTLLNYQDFEGGKELLLSSLAGLAIVFVVLAYKPKEIFASQEEADEFGELTFFDFFALIVIPRVLWLASGISTFGIFAYAANFGNDGYVKVLGIGGSTILIAILFLFGVFIKGTKKLDTLLPILTRALIAAIVAVYIYYS